MSDHLQLFGPQIDIIETTMDTNWMSRLFHNDYQINDSALIEEMLSLLCLYHNRLYVGTMSPCRRDPLRHLL